MKNTKKKDKKKTYTGEMNMPKDMTFPGKENFSLCNLCPSANPYHYHIFAAGLL